MSDKKNINRRTFLKKLGYGISLGSASSLSLADESIIQAQPKTKTLKPTDPVRKFLDSMVLSRKVVDRFLDAKADNWAKFDSRVGYVLRDSMIKDGVDGAYTIGRYEKGGYRHCINFSDRPCRINTYGNSFTQCHQVSDGETWQEILAAHFGEPIRNFGVGGHGLYQAYLRMIQHEDSETGTPYVIVNIWGDDHHRNIMSCRYIQLGHWSFPLGSDMFHANPWEHLRFDPDSGKIVEMPNLCPTPESLYLLCDKEWMYETFKDDFLVQIIMCQRGENLDASELEKLSETLNLKIDFRSSKKRSDAANTLFNECAWRSSRYVIEKTQSFLAERGKKLLVLLSYPCKSVVDACKGISRDDPKYMDWHPRAFRDFLKQKNIQFVDSLPKHMDDYANFGISPEEYAKRFYIGHYSPAGNNFFAYAIKDELVKWLDPNPPTYRGTGTTLRFEGYLPG